MRLEYIKSENGVFPMDETIELKRINTDLMWLYFSIDSACHKLGGRKDLNEVSNSNLNYIPPNEIANDIDKLINNLAKWQMNKSFEYHSFLQHTRTSLNTIENDLIKYKNYFTKHSHKKTLKKQKKKSTLRSYDLCNFILRILNKYKGNYKAYAVLIDCLKIDGLASRYIAKNYGLEYLHILPTISNHYDGAKKHTWYSEYKPNLKVHF
jgi:hypothetical protein